MMTSAECPAGVQQGEAIAQYPEHRGLKNKT